MPWQFCRDRWNATSAWSSYITALPKAILWSNQIEKHQLMVSAGESPVLHSWPRPTKSRRHLTPKEREVLFLSQERDKRSAWVSDSWSIWKYFISHSNTPSLALSSVHNCLPSTLPPSPGLPSDLSRTVISSESRDGTDLSKLLPTRSWPETCLHTHTATSGTTRRGDRAPAEQLMPLMFLSCCSPRSHLHQQSPANPALLLPMNLTGQAHLSLLLLLTYKAAPQLPSRRMEITHIKGA